MFGIQEDNKGENDPCQKKPSAYPLNLDVIDLVQNATIDRWLIMDTYYFSTARFLGALDWYAKYVPLRKLGIGLENRTVFSEDELVSRFHALHRYSVDWINIWMMPIDEKFLPYLQRWKTFCRGCGKQSILGCFDMTIQCNTGIETENQLIFGNAEEF